MCVRDRRGQVDDAAAVLSARVGLTPGGVRRYCVGDVAGEPGGVPKRGVDAYDRQDTEALLSEPVPNVLAYSTTTFRCSERNCGGTTQANGTNRLSW